MFYKKEDIDSHFICPFCSETLRDPRILSCGISVCHECIQNRIDSDTQELECSSCMKNHSPPNKEEGFCPNVVLSKLIETKAKLRAQCLAEEKRVEIDGYLNEILY